MSLTRNVLASYASQLFMALLGLVMLPVYIHYLGIEAYGLIGIFLLLQNLLQLLDLGFSATLMRQAAIFRAGALDGNSLRQLVRTIGILFGGVSLLFAGSLALASPWLATHWLEIEQLPKETVTTALLLMAPALGLRLMSSLYRALIGGFEAIVWLSGFNVAASLARFVAIVPLLELADADIIDFFVLQLVVAAGELAVLVAKQRKLLPARTDAEGARRRGDLAVLGPHLAFALSAALATAAWVAMTQVDKLLLSTLLSLSDYGLFTTAAMAAGGLLTISYPLGSALVPRLTNLYAAGDIAELSRVYRASTQLIAGIAFPAALILMLFPRELLLAWTGRPEIAAGAAAILASYAAGNAFLAINAFGSYLQYAAGNIRLLVAGLATFLALLLPSLLVMVDRFGAEGAGMSWLALQAAWFLLLMPIVHHRFLPGLHWRWVTADVVWPFLPALAVGLAARALPFPEQRFLAVAQLIAIGAAMAAATALATPAIRRRLLGLMPRPEKLSWR